MLYCRHLTRSQHKDILENSGGIGGDGRNEGPLDRTRLVVKGGLLRPRPLMGVKYIRDAWIERSLQLRFSFSVSQNFQTLLPSPIRLRIYGSSGERSMVNINEFFAQQSRFNSHWVGLTTTEALEWKEQHGTNYYTPLAPGPFLVAQRHGLGGGADVFGPAMINWAALRAANQAFDDETSRKHEADMELNTGTNICEYKNEKTKWFLATRGMKLRTLAAQRTLYIGERTVATNRKVAAICALKTAGRVGDGNNAAKHLAGNKLVEALADCAIYITVIRILDELERMVLRETQNGWDWKTELRAQLDERNVLYELVGGLSDAARVTFIRAADAINFY